MQMLSRAILLLKVSSFLKAQEKKILDTIQQAKSLETLKDPMLLQSMTKFQIVEEVLQLGWVHKAKAIKALERLLEQKWHNLETN